MASPLTAGFCQLVHSSPDTPENVQPVLQALSVKRISAPGASGQDRYRVILSDGSYFIQSMLATQLNNLVEDKSLDKNVVIKLTNFVTNSVQNRKLIIILGLEVIPWQGEKIGNPASLDSAPAAAAAPPAAAPAPAPSRGTASNARQPANGRGGGGGNRDMGPIFPIEGLSPYQNKWTIKARVTQKSEIKHWSNQRGEGKLFSVTLMDETGEIRATGFNEAVDAFYNVLEEGKVFFVTRARINIAKKQFSSVNNEYEITFDNNTEIEPCDDDSVPQIKYNFKGLGDLGDLAKDAVTDVIGVVKDVYDLGSVTSKATQKPFAKRDIQLVDQSGQSVRLTLWGKTAESFQGSDEPVIAFKGVKVSDFGGRSLSMFSSATMSINPDIPEAHSLRGWYDAEGRGKSFQQYSNAMSGAGAGAAPRPNEIKTIGQAKDEQLGMTDKTDYFTTTATIMFIKQETFSYPACANPDGCNKKVVDEGSGWRCEKCDRTWEAPIHRYILSMNVMDYTGSFWITAFNEVAEQLLGVSANELMRLKDEGDPSFERYFFKATSLEWTLQMMAKQDSFNDQIRVRYQARRATPVDYAADSRHLIEQINALAV
ncbi:Replication factor A protein 1 [Vanrija pseudolonga]|uniref:Replication protein A subunit n=1 Tax=Vanrija pseudolonga TaxID=143232 RepID=A0AAF0XZU8_9TREE|nr:Replication factor A protein 1 [Vanrija pseudolonga]